MEVGSSDQKRSRAPAPPLERALRALRDVNSGQRSHRDRVGVVVPQVHALRGQRPGLF
jgi:hypothetical protein